MESTVVDISIPPPSFKPVALSLSRISSIVKHPNKSFFNPINIFDIFLHTLYLLFIILLFFVLTFKILFCNRKKQKAEGLEKAKQKSKEEDCTSRFNLNIGNINKPNIESKTSGKESKDDNIQFDTEWSKDKQMDVGDILDEGKEEF